MSRYRLHLALLVITAGATGCNTPPAPRPHSEPGVAPRVTSGPPHVPEQTGDGWRTAALVDRGIDPAPIAEMIKRLRVEPDTGIRSVVLARHGVLVLEEYFGSAGREVIHNTSSASKSVTSALVGIAIDRGFIASVNAPLLPFFPEYDGKIANWDDRKRDITLAHVMSMTSGMKCNEDAMYPTDDWIKFYLDHPLVAPPGQAFSYNTCGTVALGSVIMKSSGLRIPAFADRYLFGPLGITMLKWPITNSLGSQGLAMTGGGLRLRSRDMAKLGQLFLNGGTWDGRRVIPESWIRESTKQHATSDLHGEAYGYLWRMVERTVDGQRVPSFEAWGNGGQFIMGFPSLDLVAVFTGENYGKFPQMEQPFALIDRYILPAMIAPAATAPRP